MVISLRRAGRREPWERGWCASSPWISCPRNLYRLFVVLHYGEWLVSHRITVKLQLTGKSRLAYKFYSDSLQWLTEDEDDDDDDDNKELTIRQRRRPWKSRWKIDFASF